MNITFSACFLLITILHNLTTINAVDQQAALVEEQQHPQPGIELLYANEEVKPSIDVHDKEEESNMAASDFDESVDEEKKSEHLALEKWFSNTKGGRNEALTEHMVHSVWGLHKRWASIAIRRRKSLSFYQRFAVFLISSGAILQTLSHQLSPPYEWIASLAAGTFLGTAPFITQHFLSHEKWNNWALSRTTSEALKSEVFKFRSGVIPYHRDNSVEVLAHNTIEILEPTAEFDTFDKMNINSILWSPNKHSYVETTKAAQSDFNGFTTCKKFCSKREITPPPKLKAQRELYIEWRLKPQVECYFRNSARRLRAINIAVKSIQNLLAATSSSIAFVAARSRFISAAKEGPTTWLNVKLSNIGVWGAVSTTIAAAIGTQYATSKLDNLASEFRNAANDIERKVLIMSSKNLKTGSPEWETFVLECEDIIATTYSALKRVTTTSTEKNSNDGTLDVKPKQWNPDAECKDEESGSYSAIDRVTWLVENKDYDVEAAKERIMEEFPDEF